MANLPSQHPNLVLHLTDSVLTPLITSARAQPHLDILTTLSHTALDAHGSAQRFGLGAPQRIMVEHGDGPVLLQSFLSPPQPTSSTTTAAANTTNNTNNPPQHQSALALAVENRAPATYTEAHLRGGAGTTANNDNQSESESESELLEHQLRNHSINPSDTTNPNSSLLDGDDDTDTETANAPPMLLAIVLSPTPDEALQARRAAGRLERVGREIQGRWLQLQGGPPPPPPPPPPRSK